MGGVVRDSQGMIILSFSKFIGIGSNVRAKLLISSELSLLILWIEIDSHIFIHILRSRKGCCDLDHIVTRIHVL